MGEQFEGKVKILDNTTKTTIMLDGDNADVIAGGGVSGKAGQIKLRDHVGNDRIWLQGAIGNIVVDGDLWVGPLHAAGVRTFEFVGNEGDIYVHHKIGTDSYNVMRFLAKYGTFIVGCNGRNGNIIAYDRNGRDVFRVTSGSGLVQVGANGRTGTVIVKNVDGSERIRLDGRELGTIKVRDAGKREVFVFNANGASLHIGIKDKHGHINVWDDNDRRVLTFDAKYAALSIGSQGNEGDIFILDEAGNRRIHLDGHTGDIKLQGADCAEEFDVAESEKICAGTVLVIGDESKLRPCRQPYDKKVVGVVSGGNGSNPGIILGRNTARNRRLPVALNGKVFCKVDADYSPIEVGDLLTTSPTAGHAMKASDSSRAFGAVIGKALGTLRQSKGMIPILVGLQ